MDKDVSNDDVVRAGTSNQDQGVGHVLDKQNIEPSNEVDNNIADKDSKKANFFDFGFLQSKLIKNLFCCLKENQQIGKMPSIFIISVVDG